MSTTFALTSAPALETPVIVIDTCLVGGDFHHFSHSSSSPFTPSPSPFSSSLSPSSPQSSPLSNFLNVPRFFRTTSPSTRHLRANRANAIPPSPLTPRTPLNSPASPQVRDGYLRVPDFGVSSPCVRWRGGSSSSLSSVCECDGVGEGAGVGIGIGIGIGWGSGRSELGVGMSSVAPPNTPCSPLGLGRLERGEEGEVLRLRESERESESESETEDSVDPFRNASGFLMRQRVLGDLPQIVVGCEEEGWGRLGVDAHAGSNNAWVVESWGVNIQLWNSN